MSAKIQLFCDTCNPSMQEIETKTVDGKRLASNHRGYYATMALDSVDQARWAAESEGWSGDVTEDTCAACNAENDQRELDDQDVADEVLGTGALDLAGLDVNDLVKPAEASDED